MIYLYFSNTNYIDKKNYHTALVFLFHVHCWKQSENKVISTQ